RTSCFPGRAGPRTEASLPVNPVGRFPTCAGVRHVLCSYVSLLVGTMAEREGGGIYILKRFFHCSRRRGAVCWIAVPQATGLRVSNSACRSLLVRTGGVAFWRECPPSPGRQTISKFQ